MQKKVGGGEVWSGGGGGGGVCEPRIEEHVIVKMQKKIGVVRVRSNKDNNLKKKC